MKYIYHCRWCNRYKFDHDWVKFGLHGKAMIAQLTGVMIELIMITCEDCEQIIPTEFHNVPMGG